MSTSFKTSAMLKIQLFSLLIFISCGQLNVQSSDDQKSESDTFKPISKTTAVNKYFPFELKEFDGQFMIIAAIESPALYPSYVNMFEKNGYSGNGYCWEGHIVQILEKLDKALIKHIDFDPEGGGFYANADTKENQIKFAELLSPIFADLKKLEEWVKKADRSRIDD